MHALLKQYFGFNEFRPLQKEIIDHVLAKRDTLVIMPTGSGKSLCYQLPALALDGVTLVVSPLIALMKDQVDGLRANGIQAACINSTYTAADIRATLEEARRGQCKLLYVAPERLAIPTFRDTLQTLPIRLIAVDEAHCISEWGHDFRPEYRTLDDLRPLFPGVPWIALTATANDQVRTDIIKQLGLQGGRAFVSTFNRPNLTYLVRPKAAWRNIVTKALESVRGSSAIIYCLSRKDTERIATRLQTEGWNALPYHAGLTDQLRRETQEKFIRDECPIVVATIAFGMGINKPNVRLVVHADLPRSVEGYYQETGRAGRDGLPSTCLFFYSPGDRWKREFILRQASHEEQVRARRQLEHMVRYAESKDCRRGFLLRYFGEEWRKPSCESCDVCLGDKAAFVVTTTETTYDVALFEELRALRKRLADERRVPPYVIFSDRSLREMAERYPQSLASLRRIHGVGREKERTLGATVLATICTYAKTRGKADTTVIAKATEPLADTLVETKAYLEQKLSAQEIARRRGLVESTIINHIEKLVWREHLDITHLRPSDHARLEAIHNAFRQAKTRDLAPVRQRLGEDFSYAELRLARLFIEKY